MSLEQYESPTGKFSAVSQTHLGRLGKKILKLWWAHERFPDPESREG